VALEALDRLSAHADAALVVADAYSNEDGTVWSVRRVIELVAR